MSTTKLVPYWKSECGRAIVYIGDCRDILARLEVEQFHAVVTDPPYGLEFMGKEFDAPWKYQMGPVWSKKRIEHLTDGGVDAETRRASEMSDPVKAKYLRHNVEYVMDSHKYQEWFNSCAEAILRVAKPGAHLLSFGGTRTWHRMACAIEDAGWEYRDTLGWIYGCLSDDTEILTANGWRTYNNIEVGDVVAAWDCTTDAIILEPVDEVIVAPYNGNMVKFENDNTDQLLTPNHRVYKRHAVRFQSEGMRIRAFESDWTVSQAGNINRWQPIKLPLSGYHDGPGIGGLDWAELLGWVWSEGGYDEVGTGVRITQSSVNADKVEMIEKCLLANMILSTKHYTRERQYKDRTYTEHTWFISGHRALDIRRDLPGKHPTWKLLWRMTLNEKRSLLNSAMLGDGSGTAFYQKDDADREWFQALLHCIGMQGRDNAKKYYISIHDNPTTELQSRHLQQSTEPYTGNVWCVCVRSGAFIARRNGKVFITGNSGFPKSHDISNAIDKVLGAERQVVGKSETGLGAGQFTQSDIDGGYGFKSEYSVTVPATEDARRWSGWGNSLKPAYEPIIMARKPIYGNLAQNILVHNCGGLNIDACRIGTEQVGWNGGNGFQNTHSSSAAGGLGSGEPRPATGRFPANIIHNGSEEVLAIFPQSSSSRQKVTSAPGQVYGGGAGLPSHTGVYGFDDSGSAARYFYTAKADKDDRPHGNGGSKKVQYRLRDSLTPEQRQYVLKELAKSGVDLRQL